MFKLIVMVHGSGKSLTHTRIGPGGVLKFSSDLQKKGQAQPEMGLVGGPR